jgi:hypothetical protein
MTDAPSMEFPQAFEQRLGAQLVEDGLAIQRDFFKKVTGDLLVCGKGDPDECTAASGFMELFGKTYLNACQAYMANLPLSVFVTKTKLPEELGVMVGDGKVLTLMLFCEAAGPTGIVTDYSGELTASAKSHLAITSFIVSASKFSTKRPTETVDECLLRFITAEKETFDSMNLVNGQEFVKWMPRYIFDMAITRMIEGMDPEFVYMRVDNDHVRFVVHQDVPGTAFYKATFIHLNLDILLAQGITSFENQIYRHPRYRANPSDTPKEATVEDKAERNIADVVKAILKEVPEDVKTEEPAVSYLKELNEILDELTTLPEGSSEARWNQLVEIMNAWMGPSEILEHEWKLKAIAKLMDQSDDKVRELTQRYMNSEGISDD